MLELRFLGAPEVRVDGEPAVFKTRKALLLLAYLALEEGRHSRERLAGLFWPDSDPEAGRASLRNTLTYVREALGVAAGCITGDKQYLQFQLPETLFCDVEHLEAAASSARRSSSDRTPTDADEAAMAGAVTLLRGEFLQDFTAGEGGALEEWLVERREASARWADLVLDQLSSRQLEKAVVQEAVETAARWTELDRLNELAWRRLAQAHAQASRRDLARAALKSCRAALSQELGLEPSPETLALEASLERDANRPREATRRSGHDLVNLVREGHLVGREDEFKRLVAAYNHVKQERPAVVLIAGEAGIGKTLLAREFATWAADEGATVLRGRAFEVSCDLPFGALGDALRRHLMNEPDAVRLVGRSRLAELSGLISELRDRHPDLPAATADERLARSRLLDAISGSLLALSSEAPLVLHIDDLQWADGATLDAIRYSLARLSEEARRAFLVLSVRSEALGPDSRLNRWLAELRQDAPIERLDLTELGPETTLRLVEALLGPGEWSDQAHLAAWLHEETGGQPLYLVEAIKNLAERGTIAVDAHGNIKIDFAGLESGSTGVQAVIAARLASLDPAALAMAHAASVLGDRASFELLRSTAGLDEDSAIYGLEFLMAAGLVRETHNTSSGEFYALSHDKVRETTYAALSAPRRSLLHRRAYHEVRRASASSGDESASSLGRHAEGAGDREGAAEHFFRAGQRAARFGAAAEARALLGRSLDLIPLDDDHFRLRRPRLLNLFFLQDGPDGRRAAQVTLLGDVRQRALSRGATAEAAFAELLAAVAALDDGDGDAASNPAAAGLTAARASGHPWAIAPALIVAGMKAHSVHGQEAFTRLQAEAAEVARKADDKEALSGALHNLGLQAFFSGDRERARTILEESIAAKKEFDLGEWLDEQNLLAQVEAADGNVDRAEDILRQVVAFSRARGYPQHGYSAEIELAELALWRGDNEVALSTLESAVEQARKFQVTSDLWHALARLGIAAARLGDIERARSCRDELVALGAASRSLRAHDDGSLILGNLYLELGEYADAEKRFRQSIAIRGGDHFVAEAAIGLANAWWRQGRSEDAAFALGFVRACPATSARVREAAEALLAGMLIQPGSRLAAQFERGHSATSSEIEALLSGASASIA